MEKETILFFQGLYQYSISRQKILDFCKEKQHADMQKKATFLNQILIGDEASSVKKEYELLQSKIDMIREPEEILGIQIEFEKLVSKANKYMLDTMQAFEKRVFMPEEIKVLHPVFEKFAVEKVHKMISLSLYYLLCQSGQDIQKIVKGYCGREVYDVSQIVSCIRLYNEFAELINQGKILKWRYSLRQVEFDKLGKIQQFFCEEDTAISHLSIVGKPVIHYTADISNQGYVVEGRGCITNLNLKKHDLMKMFAEEEPLLSKRDLTLEQDYIWKLDFSSNPVDVLNTFFEEKPFAVSAPEYFRFANLCMLFQRVKTIFGDS